LISLKALCHFY